MSAIKGSEADQLEEQVQRELQLLRTAGSGAVRGDGDVKTSWKEKGILQYYSLLAEAKHTNKESKSLSVPFSVLEKTKHDAYRRGLIPLVVKQYSKTEPYVIMSLKDFARIYNKMRELMIEGGSHAQEEGTK